MHSTPRHEDLLAAVVAAAPPALASLTAGQRQTLLDATGDLLTLEGASAAAELARFTGTASRCITVSEDELREVHGGRVVLVTGGTGCIGSEVIRLVTAFGPSRVISVSRGFETRWPRFPDVEYVNLDIRDGAELAALIYEVKPDIVYHLAAQHDPGLAEVEAGRTLSTNVLGTNNVIAACRQISGIRLACASTGKALRPFTRDIYCASKKMAEWLLANAARDADMKVSAVRFTHVVDNSIILTRLGDWVARGEPVRLHNLTAMFYMQSAREAAQLLISSLLDATPGGLALTAIRDLGWPIALLDLALGVIQQGGLSAPLYVCGVEAGYEKSPYPALYDPGVSGEVSPLFNALEAFGVQRAQSSDDVDMYVLDASVNVHLEQAISQVGALAYERPEDPELRSLVAACGWDMLTDFLGGINGKVLSRHVSVLEHNVHDGFSDDDNAVRSKIVTEQQRREERPVRIKTPSRRLVPPQRVGSSFE